MKTIKIILGIILLVVHNKILHSTTLYGQASASTQLASNHSYIANSPKNIMINFRGEFIRLELVSSLQDLFRRIAIVIYTNQSSSEWEYINSLLRPSGNILKPILDRIKIIPTISKQVLFYDKLTPAELLAAPSFETCCCILNYTSS